MELCYKAIENVFTAQNLHIRQNQVENDAKRNLFTTDCVPRLFVSENLGEVDVA